MLDRDMRPTRFDLTLQYAREFVTEWFDQNPLGQIGVVGMRAGLAERVGEMSGNPHDVLKYIADRHKLEPTGEPSLQNAIELAKTSMKFVSFSLPCDANLITISAIFHPIPPERYW